MQDGLIKVAAATPEIRVADCVYNGEKILSLMESAAHSGVRLLVLPELCITGATCGDLFLQPQLIRGAWDTLMTLAARSATLPLVAVLGLPVIHRGKLYNCAAVLARGRVLGLVPKTHPAHDGALQEGRYFQPAPATTGMLTLGNRDYPMGANLIFCWKRLPAFRLSVEIGQDLWAPVQPSQAHALAGSTLIANPAAHSEIVGRSAYRRGLVTGQSARLICGYLHAGAGEGESTTDMVFAGHNLVAEKGTLLAENRLFSGDMATTEIDLERLEGERLHTCTFVPEDSGYTRIEFDLPLEETTLTRPIPPHPFVPGDKARRDARCQGILAIQSQGLKKRLAHTRAKTAVVGISGGLDSCLALLVTVGAMDLLGRPRGDVLAVTLPGFGTTRRTRDNAEMLCRHLGVSFREIDITQAVTGHLADIGHDPALRDITYENAQARERTQILMDIANQTGGLVVGTGGLSELALGWATYNGDHMSMYGVNASVPKTLVRHIVGYAAETAENPDLAEVLRDILDTPVSPELLPPRQGEIAQRTEDIVGPYELHDFFLYYGIRWGFTPAKVYRLARYAFRDTYEADAILQWLKGFYRRFFAQQFKRSCLPDGPKVGTVSLSPRGDWRMPSDAAATLWLQSLETLGD